MRLTIFTTRCLLAVSVCDVSVLAMAQDVAPLRLHWDKQQNWSERIMQQPISPRFVSPAVEPFSTNELRVPQPRLDLTWRAHESLDSVNLHLESSKISPFPSTQDYHFPMNPYARDWASSGVIARAGEGYFAGSGSFQSYPALGNIARASLSLTQPVGENLTLTMGISGNKYHIGRDAWNDYGVFGNARFRLNDRLALKAFGQYYTNPVASSVGAISFTTASSYGGSLDIKMSDKFSLDVGAQRYYDPYTRTWHTVPILAPTVNLWGQPVSVDMGGLLHQLLDAIFDFKNNGRGYNYKYNDSAPWANGKVPKPAGFNPNSPVRIPKALR